MKALSLEALKAALSDNKLEMTVGVIQKMVVADDRSVLKVQVLLLTDNLVIIARMSWDAVGPEAGLFQFPSVGDLVIVGYVDDNENEAFVLKRLTSKDDKIPLQAIDGHLALRALPGKKAHLISDTAVLLGRGGADPDEPLVLGTVFKEAYSTDLEETAIHKHVGNLGYLTAPPDNAAEFVALKASPVDDLEMLSDLSKTEK